MGIAYNTSIVRDGLVLHLDAANKKSYSGTGTVWKDLSGLANNGTLVNGVGYSSDNKGTMVFDGVDDYAISNVGTDQEHTFSLWFNQNQRSSPYASIISSRINSTERNWIFVESNGTLAFSLGFTNGTRIFSALNFNNSIDLNKWYFVNFTWDDNKIARAYLNDQFLGQFNFSPRTVRTGDVVWIGRDNDSRYYLKGDISNVQIYNRALSLQEIQQNFEAHRGRYGI
jgi:hypothetical protein